MADIDYYKILGVSKEANASQIKARYQLLAKKFHPDHDGDDSVMSLINVCHLTTFNIIVSLNCLFVLNSFTNS